MKIKVKKEMNLHELIKWAWENDVKGKTFKVEVEELITEDTKISTLIELFVSDYGKIIHTYHRTSIGEAIGEVHKGAEALPTAFYMLNDDMTMTLIWKDGELVK
ncbi:hypothetical protein K7N39_001893 [Staphylococcus pseudintermedius]|nr:hypothetical protein [Staphylococcus pseudintermedius]